MNEQVKERTPKMVRSYADLRFVRKLGDLVEFAAPSRHEPGRTNVVSLDTKDGATHCTCRSCETLAPGEPARCWLTRVVADVWAIHECRMTIAPYRVGGAQLLEIERAAREADDRIMLTAAGDEVLARIVRDENRKAAMSDLYGDEVA